MRRPTPAWRCGARIGAAQRDESPRVLARDEGVQSRMYDGGFFLQARQPHRLLKHPIINVQRRPHMHEYALLMHTKSTVRHDPRGGQGVNACGAGCFQGHGARLQRGARRAHIVDENQGPSAGTWRRPEPIPAQRKGAVDVRMPSIGSQFYLRTCVPATNEDIEHRQTKMARQLASLIETTRSFSSSMKRNRDHAVGIFKHLSAALPHHRRETGGKRTAPVVLERVNNLAQRSFILPDRPRALDQVPADSTTSA